MEPIFVLQNVKYKNILDIDKMTIPIGVVTCVIGESGSGKSTLLKLLNQIISADSGIIQYRGKNVEELDVTELRRQVIMLQQHPVIYKGTIRDNLLIGLQLSEKPIVGEEMLQKALQELNVRKQLDEDASNLSGGEKQRIAIARVMLMDPDVYLLDEPSSALDENTEDLIIQQLVATVKRRNKTLVMVTHSKKVANQYADNIIEIKRRVGE